MLDVKTKKELTQLANDMARGFAIVKYNHVLYLPVHYLTGTFDPALKPVDRVWRPLSVQHVLDLAGQTSKVMFYGETEKSNFYGMVEQASESAWPTPGTVLLNAGGALVELRADGKLHDPTQEFCPHYIGTPVNDDVDAKAEVFDTLMEWLDGSEEDAESLLHHLATALASHWSAVKYVLLIGEGRNGKSLLLKMVMHLLGEDNISHVTRQDMSASKSTCLDLQSKLANIVFDGPASYLKDSGPEKSLIAGETTPIRRLYASQATPVQTKALFIEGLNREPKTGDKSLALQKRLVRFQFTRTYELDYVFEHHMTSEPVLGAFLALLLDHYVRQGEVHLKLKPTKSAQRMQIEQMHTNSAALQFIEWFETEDALGVEGLKGELLSEVVAQFKRWRLVEMGDINVWADKDVEAMLLPLFTTERKSKRVNGRVHKVRAITGFQLLLGQFIHHMRGEEEADDQASDSGTTLVDRDELLHGVESAPTD